MSQCTRVKLSLEFDDIHVNSPMAITRKTELSLENGKKLKLPHLPKLGKPAYESSYSDYDLIRPVYESFFAGDFTIPTGSEGTIRYIPMPRCISWNGGKSENLSYQVVSDCILRDYPIHEKINSIFDWVENIMLNNTTIIDGVIEFVDQRFKLSFLLYYHNVTYTLYTESIPDSKESLPLTNGAFFSLDHSERDYKIKKPIFESVGNTIVSPATIFEEKTVKIQRL